MAFLDLNTYSYGDIDSPIMTGEIVNRMSQYNQKLLKDSTAGTYVIVKIPVEGGAAFSSATPGINSGKVIVETFSDEDIFKAAIDSAKGSTGFYGVYEKS